ncbi:MAG: hypothetical protein ABEI78_01535 [Candidatus Nanohaloarchaea archaeon]
MADQDLLNQIVNRVNDFNRRIRDLEEKVRNLNARVNTLDDSLLDKTQDLEDEIQDLRDDLGDLRDRVANMEVDIKEINREKRKFVSSQELEEIENYMDLMNPIQSNLVTKDKVEDMIEEHNEGNKGLSKKQVERLIEKKMREREENPDK